jgi:hypothetical protein
LVKSEKTDRERKSGGGGAEYGPRKKKGWGAEYGPSHVEDVSVWNGLFEGVDLLLWDAPARHIVNHLLGHPQTGRRYVPVQQAILIHFYKVKINFMIRFTSCLS